MFLLIKGFPLEPSIFRGHFEVFTDMMLNAPSDRPKKNPLDATKKSAKCTATSSQDNNRIKMACQVQSQSWPQR
ncbi:uncharacterized protein PHALS_11005 [Plasmopara halstedii]|uniref:Uncharacterized protein n=1 Tax=Plasmopara halstedii TaxID=4781 RepID=A0A0P1AI25_PLAHL|nr:uncharacterized protein PHALS_11005 [Plasmopara halstedii]CEG40825.1 hypothetical protein PHALS_11005 [Plasmopara halstedii]|eukprot:XP_024577194.1 hypothetical protein PHALS_11005 [Plasmopara halstedii]